MILCIYCKHPIVLTDEGWKHGTVDEWVDYPENSCNEKIGGRKCPCTVPKPR